MMGRITRLRAAVRGLEGDEECKRKGWGSGLERGARQCWMVDEWVLEGTIEAMSLSPWS